LRPRKKSRRERQALRSTGGRRYSENPQYGFKTFPHWYLRQRFLTVTSTNNALINKQYVMRLLVRGRRSYFFETIANAVKRLDHIELDGAPCPGQGAADVSENFAKLPELLRKP
jgi:hypothetical protein